ncbi:DUF6249 domain-containing protein [Mucilaginibacter calamicampi]|uniref:DUF6249 domain-containing protein n=1 Tax=Mucilaginibacter calamicampi TaxID=1302352 RepID=A0ABW2YXH1_9SPHI
MDASRMALLIPIFTTLGFFSLIFGIVYLRNKERMAMIERGMDPRLQIDTAGSRNYILTAAMVLIGGGVGLFIAFMLEWAALPPDYNPTAIYFACIAFFSGLGLLGAYVVEKKQAKE